MDLNAYFDNAEGMGIFSTADGDGNVDAALYGRPHMQADGTLEAILARWL